MKSKKTIIGAVAILAILGLAALAFADFGYGNQMAGRNGYMMGPGYGGGYMMGPGYRGGHMMDWNSGYGPHMRGTDGYTGRYQDGAVAPDGQRDNTAGQARGQRPDNFRGGAYGPRTGGGNGYCR